MIYLPKRFLACHTCVRYPRTCFLECNFEFLLNLGIGRYRIKGRLVNLPFGQENASSAPIECSKLKNSNDDSKAASQCELAAVGWFMLARFNSQLSPEFCYQSEIEYKLKGKRNINLIPFDFSTS